jgi:hypothetical protein
MTINKEFIDQLLHILAGALLVIIFAQFMPVPMAAFFAMTTGIVREIYQRYDIDRVWYDCQAGCRKDLLFWGIGVLIGWGVIWLI